MLLVKTKLGLSKIQGIGLFAVEPLSKGTKIWEYHPYFDKAFTKEEFDRFDRLHQEFLALHAYQYQGIYYLCIDDARFLNHSTDPNCIDIDTHSKEPDRSGRPTIPGGYTVALKDIEPGEELTCNYSYFGFDKNDHAFNFAWQKPD